MTERHLKIIIKSMRAANTISKKRKMAQQFLKISTPAKAIEETVAVKMGGFRVEIKRRQC